MKIFACLAVLLIVASAASAETIYYDIRQMGFDGKATLSFEGLHDYKGRHTYLIIFNAQGNNFKDKEEIFVDPQAYKPLFVVRDFNLSVFGHGHIVEEYLPNKVLITKTDGDKVTAQEIDKSGVDNIYGFIARYRKHGSFKTGDVIDVNLPTKDLKIALVRQEDLKMNNQTYASYYMESQPAKYKIWFDASAHKWPLKISGAVGVINSVMTMTGYRE